MYKFKFKMAEREEVKYLHWWDGMVVSTKHPMVHLSISYLQKHQQALVNNMFSFSFVSARTLWVQTDLEQKHILCKICSSASFYNKTNPCNLQYRMLCKYRSVRLLRLLASNFFTIAKKLAETPTSKKKKKGIRPSKF